MKRRRGALAPLLLLILLLNLIHGALSGLLSPKPPRLARDIPHRQELTLALEDLQRRGPRAAETGGVLEVPAGGRRIPARAFIDLQGAQGLGSGFYTYGVGAHAEVTASASGVDTRHQIVNAYLVGYRPFDAENIWVPMQVLSMRKRYQYDHLQYPGRMEVWQTSEQAFHSPRGDCEDHAIALADWLIDMGEDARVAIGTHRGQGHAWVVLFHQGQEFLLEATQKQWSGNRVRYPLAALMPDYRPKFMFNRKAFWRNNGSSQTTRYASPDWEMKSRYVAASASRS